MGFVSDDRKVEEKWKFCARIRILLSLAIRVILEWCVPSM